jgi:hypothetical protein
VLILVSSFVVKYFYVFDYTDYTNYLLSDMGGYWERATESFTNNDRAEEQWAIWPPFAHMTLAWFFKILYFFDLYEHRLEWVLDANIILSVLSTVWVYLIALKIYPSKAYALLSSTIYAFFFPLIYLNAFVLSEHLSVFALLLSIVLVLYARPSWMEYLIAGVTLAFAIGVRPSFGVLGLPAFIYIIARDGTFRWRNFLYGVAFTTGYAIFLIHIVATNHANSEGKVSFLSAGGGISYYLSACEPYELVTHYNGYKWSISAPAQSGNPERGIADTTEPFYHQQYYYDKGDVCHKRNGLSWVDRLKRYRLFFEDSMFPYRYDAKYAKYGLPVFSQIALGMSLLLFFLPLLFFNKKILKNGLVFIAGILILQLMMHYYYTVEQRYLYGFFFAIVLLSTLVLFQLAALGRKLSIKMQLLIGLTALVSMFLFWKYNTVSPEERSQFSVDMHLVQDTEAILNIDQERHPRQTLDTRIDTIGFKSYFKLVHEHLGDYGFEENFFIDFSTYLHVLKEGDYTFVVASDDGFKLSLDQREILRFSGERDVDVNRKRVHLVPGDLYHYRLSYFQGDGDLALHAFYEIAGKRFLIGEESPYIHFSHSETNTTR